MNALKHCLSFVGVLLTLALPAWAGDLHIQDLRCEYVQAPLGVDSPNPRLFWKLESKTPGQCQTAYQIQAASSLQALKANQPDLWDSGKLNFDRTTHIPYAGKTLSSWQQVFWRVRVWDKSCQATSWSQPASWTMGILSEQDWHADWIGAPSSQQSTATTLLLRREFSARSGLRRALLCVCGLGCYEMTLNGSKVNDELFPPGWTTYSATCLYNTYDVTELIRKGPNALGLHLGNGMYNVTGGRFTKFKGSFGPLKAICVLRLEYKDHFTELVSSDAQWRVLAGPETFCSVYGGEDYDARLEPAGWQKPNFNDRLWAQAAPTTGPGGQLKGLSCSAPPIHAFEVLKPISAKTIACGTTVYDLGQNVSLMPRLKMKGPAGTVVRIIPAELLHPDGSVDRGSCGANRPAYWQYTLAGKGTESWFPRFFYHGCRYLQVECTAPTNSPLPQVQSLEGVVVHADSPPAGEFECSNPLFNRIRHLVRWAQRSNMMSVLTDCPHRERLGWLEQDHLNGPALRYEFDMAWLFTKVVNDMADAQTEAGLVPDIAPEYTRFGGGFRDSPEWGSACILIPWQQYEFTGDTAMLQNRYSMMTRYVAYLASRATNDIVSYGLGDWYDIGPKAPGVAQLTPVALTATAFYYYDTWVLSQVAQLLGKTEDARLYAGQAQHIRDSFNARFYNQAQGSYATGSQCANAMPLVMGLPAPADRPAVLQALIQDVQSRSNALTAGDVGYRYLLRALADGERSDLIFAINNRSDKPGYGYQLAHGATSLTEAWNARRASSQNHFMLGQITEWFYHDLAGIACDPEGPGFKKILIHPAPVGDISWVKASYESLHGPILSEWKRENNQFVLKVSIPANTSATVYLPKAAPEQVECNGRTAIGYPGLRWLGTQQDKAVYGVESGTYTFAVPQ